MTIKDKDKDNQTSIIENKSVLRCLQNELDYLGQFQERLDVCLALFESVLAEGLTNQSAGKLLVQAEYVYLKAYWIKAEIEAQHGVHEMNMDIFDKDGLL